MPMSNMPARWAVRLSKGSICELDQTFESAPDNRANSGSDGRMLNNRNECTRRCPPVRQQARIIACAALFLVPMMIATGAVAQALARRTTPLLLRQERTVMRGPAMSQIGHYQKRMVKAAIASCKLTVLRLSLKHRVGVRGRRARSRRANNDAATFL